LEVDQSASIGHFFDGGARRPNVTGKHREVDQSRGHSVEPGQLGSSSRVCGNDNVKSAFQ
jgi:hypothetical protein